MNVRTILASLLAVLFLASSAWAESGWLLQEQQRMVTEPPATELAILALLRGHDVPQD